MPTKISFDTIEKAVKKAKPEEQRRLLVRLPLLLGIQQEAWELLKLSESSFDFWNNPYDNVYNSL